MKILVTLVRVPLYEDTSQDCECSPLMKTLVISESSLFMKILVKTVSALPL